jgi:guanosine-3',5'-bis(diphosphate) 3'-pyrophosphohydrolase
LKNRFEKFAEKVESRYKDDQADLIFRAAKTSENLHKGQKRASGEPYFIHPLRVGEILIDMNLDAETVAAGLLHDVLEDTEFSNQKLEESFGTQVELLVEGVTKINIINAKHKNVQEAETIRKMLLAMTKDIRVILIKLADKLHNMSTLEHLMPHRKKAIAQECLDIYAPMAGRLGISWLKAELEDLALKHLNSDAYYQIKESLTAKKTERQDYLERVKEAIVRESEKEEIEIDVTTRAKHFYSIYRKMKKRQKDMDEIYDLLGIRILCANLNECYTLLGLVHRLWPPIEGRFKDYIAMPKSNGYQSLHTSVMCYEGRLLEIQIRTNDMHRTAEHGIAAHWAYKRGLKSDQVKSTEIKFISKLKSWDSMKSTSGEFLEQIKKELLKDSIYVFTPQGDIVELPKGSTAIDFAYHIHTEVGHHCIGAKADGNIIALTAELKNTQVMEVLTSNNAQPRLDWLRHVKTATARSKIRNWLNKHDENLILSKSIVAKRRQQDIKPPKPQYKAPEGEIVKHVVDGSRVVFKVGDERNMMIKIANCCHPTTGDDIIGYISRGRGIIVHRKGCPNFKHIANIKERSIDVEWETVSPKITRRFHVSARITGDLFSEIEGAVRKHHGHLIEGKLEEVGGNLSGSFTMEFNKREDVKRIMKSIRTIPSVLNIQAVS